MDRYGNNIHVFDLIERGDLDAALKLRNDININHLNNAIFHGRTDIVKYLVENHIVNPSQKSRYYPGNNSLHYAAEYGRLEIIKILLRHGMDAYETNMNEYNALCWAAAAGHFNIVKFLIEINNTSPHVKNKHKRNALHFASMCGHLEIVQYLIREYGMDPNERDINNESAVDMASQHTEVHSFLKCQVGATKLVLRSLGLINIY
jgi:ankyrin repeat protein